MAIKKIPPNDVLSHNNIRVKLDCIITDNLTHAAFTLFDNKNGKKIGILNELKLNPNEYNVSPLIRAFKILYSPKGKIPKANSPTQICLKRLEEDLLVGYTKKEEEFSSKREYLDDLVKYNLNKF